MSNTLAIWPKFQVTNSLSLDSNIGRDTLLVFSYTDTLNVSVVTDGDNQITYEMDLNFHLTSVRIAGIVVRES